MFSFNSLIHCIRERLCTLFDTGAVSTRETSYTSPLPASSLTPSSASFPVSDAVSPGFDEERFLLEYRDILPSFLWHRFGKDSYEQLSAEEKSVLVNDPDLPLKYASKEGEIAVERLARLFPDEWRMLHTYLQRMVEEQPNSPQSRYIPLRRVGESSVIDFGLIAYRWKLDERSLLTFVQNLQAYESLKSSLQTEDPECPSSWLHIQCCLRIYGWTFEVRDFFISMPFWGPFQGIVEYRIHHAFWLPCRVKNRRSTFMADELQHNLRYLFEFQEGTRTFDPLLCHSILHLVEQLKQSGIYVDVAFYCPRSDNGQVFSQTHFFDLKKGMSDLGISCFDSINAYLKHGMDKSEPFASSLSSSSVTTEEEKEMKRVPLSAGGRLTVVIGMCWSNPDLHKICSAILHRFSQRPPWLFCLSLSKLLDSNEVGFLKSQHQRIRSFLELTANLHSVEGMFRNCVSFWETVQDLPCFSLFSYLPTTDPTESTPENWQIRTLIWDFKASPQHDEPLWLTVKKNIKASDRVVQLLVRVLSTCFQHCLTGLTLVCAPASSRAVQERRYHYFSSLLCKQTGMTNAYPFVRVEVDGEAKHSGGKLKAKISFDPHFFRGKYVLIFDDVITKGTTMHELKEELEGLGAVVIGGCSIGRTQHSQSGQNWVDLI